MHFLKNYKLILLIVFTFSVFFIIGDSFILLSFSAKQPAFTDTDRIQLKKDRPVMQKFQADENNLSVMKVYLNHVSLLPGDEIRMELNDENCQETIRHDSLTFWNIFRNNFYPFNFSPIPDSQGRTYCLKMSYQPKKERSNDRTPNLLAAAGPDFEQSSYTSGKGNEKMGKSLVFRPLYKKDSMHSSLETLNQRMSQYKPFFFKNFYLTTIIIISLISIIGLTIILILL